VIEKSLAVTNCAVEKRKGAILKVHGRQQREIQAVSVKL
jgi:hypothetical protein